MTIKAAMKKFFSVVAPLVLLCWGGNALAQAYLHVDIQPDLAAQMGARWRVDGGIWHTEDETVYVSTSFVHIVSFNDIVGWVTPSSFTIDTPLEGVTYWTNGIYARRQGNIIIENLTPGGEWFFYSYPPDYTGPFNGTADTNIAAVPAGYYTIRFMPLTGYNLPAAHNTTQLAQDPPAVPNNVARFDGTYLPGLSLRVQVYTPADLPHLPGTGYGTFQITPTNAYIMVGDTFYFSSNADIVVTAIPTNITIGGDDYESFFFEWDGTGISTPFGPVEPGVQSQRYNNPIYLTMNRNRELRLLFSREYYWYDNCGDLDADILPDEWEIAAAGGSSRLWATNFVGMYGTYGNPDNDKIPAISTNAPLVYNWESGTRSVQIGTNTFGWGYRYERINSLDAAAPAYPLPPARLAQGGYSVTSPNAVNFVNLFECRGLDGYYRGRSPGGVIPDDDPYTSPTAGDTDSDGFEDGWEYYFWRWRSADAYNRGLTDSCNLDWVTFRPNVWNNNALDSDERSHEFDTDGMTDAEEYTLGTDPTHCDTDGDFMDDKWERDRAGVSGLNPLVYDDAEYNNDEDFMALLAGSGMIVGQQGTVFPYDVYQTGSNYWADVDANGTYTIYHDWVLICGSPLTNGISGTLVAPPILYGSTNDLDSYQRGDEVWQDANANGAYDLGELIIVDKPLKHDRVYTHPIDTPWPGWTMFNPYTAWRLSPPPAVDTIPYNNYEEYLSADNYGRIPWDPGGRRITALVNEIPYAPARTDATNPNSNDTDSDQIVDGWELYVGLNPNWIADAGGDSDGDGLPEVLEWANTQHPLGQGNLGTGTNMWNKPLPTDPGVLTNAFPNDPHPADTDWDGLPDGGERTANSNPSTWDSDGDNLPDGWEVYAGTDPLAPDAMADTDGDGLLNWQEYWTGAIPEWMNCRHDWNIRFDTRLAMQWDGGAGTPPASFIPPDFVTCGSFLLVNRVMDTASAINLGARNSRPYTEYHTALAGATNAIVTGPLVTIDPTDSDGDGLDDYWEVYHGLNPLMGLFNLMEPMEWPAASPTPWRYTLAQSYAGAAAYDALPSESGFQVGPQGVAFRNLSDMYNYVTTFTPGAAYSRILGPHNFGRALMDPDADGLANADEYSYHLQRSTYNTDPSPLFRTDPLAVGNLTGSYFDPPVGQFFCPWVPDYTYAYFPFEMVEGFDTDNDGVGDRFEINPSSDIIKGHDPLDPRNPLRNRAVYLRGKEDYLRTPMSVYYDNQGLFLKFCVEAWVCPDEPAAGREQFVIDKAAFYPNPHDVNNPLRRSNFTLGIDPQGRPFIRYHGRSSGTAYSALSQMGHRLQPNTWAHLAGVYDGQWLRIYVNGIESKAVYTTELPANGFVTAEGFMGPHTMMLGAEDPIPNATITVNDWTPQWFTSAAQPTNGFYKGYLDEVRVWNGSRSVAGIIADKDRRFSREEVAALSSNRFSVGVGAPTALFSYYTFDDVPDPVTEGVVPSGMNTQDTALKLHPTLDWWANTYTRSRVYTGHTNAPYNYIMFAQDHVGHVATVPPANDVLHVVSNSLPAEYRNPTRPYHLQYVQNTPQIRDLLFHNYACAKAVYPSWLPSVDGTADGSDSDGDGLPDWWEIQYGLDPYDPNGVNGAWGDNDNDGLNNFAEYSARTNPNNWDSNGDGISDYDSSDGPGSRTYGELYTDGDMMPDEWEVANGLDPRKYDADGDLDGDGWSNLAEYQAGTLPNDPTNFPLPSLSITADYGGAQSVFGRTFRLFAYHEPTMDGAPQAVFSGAYNRDMQSYVFPTTASNCLHEGELYLFGFLDLDGNSTWNQNEPCSVALGQWSQPYYVEWSGIEGLEITMSDRPRGSERFLWPDPGTTNFMDVSVFRISAPGWPAAPINISRAMRYNRLFFHEWDYLLAGYLGLPVGTYQWRVGLNTGYFAVNYPDVQAVPTLLYPRGDRLIYGRSQMRWTMDVSTPAYHLQILAADGTVVYDYYRWSPNPNRAGEYKDYLPFYTGEFAPGVYYWRVAGWTPKNESAWSEWQTFEVNLGQQTGSRGISGNIYYFGKVRADRIVLEAFTTPCFSGAPVARMVLAPPITSDSLKSAFSMWGLQAKEYYLRAYIDTTPSGAAAPSGRREFWKSYGFVMSPTNTIFQPVSVDLRNTTQVTAQRIVIRDLDTDNDELPDAWEMQHFGNLDQTGDMDYDGDGLTNLEEYAIEFLLTDPTRWDSDGDRLSDYYELLYDGTKLYNPYNPVSNRGGTGLNATDRDTDGDGFTDWQELAVFGTNPLDPNSYPGGVSPYGSACGTDYNGDGRSELTVYDQAGGRWYIADAQGAWNWFGIWWGGAGLVPVPGDYNGDGRADLAVYNQADGRWYITDAQGAWNWFGIWWGGPGLAPVAGDYNGDGRSDLAVYNQSTGHWYITDAQGAWNWFGIWWGGPGLLPVAGDYNGDGRSDLAVYSEATGGWYITDGLGAWNWPGILWGGAGFKPVRGDFNGDGCADLAVYCESTGYWYITDAQGAWNYFGIWWGGQGLVPVAGDFDGDGRSDLAVYSPATGQWYITDARGLWKQFGVVWGGPGLSPVGAAW